jgi:tRNA(Arg) A34 adenosine deaminase TadA
MTEHETLMTLAIDAAYKAVEHGNHPFGAILVKEDSVLLVAENTVYTENDVTNHAEMNLVRAAVQQYVESFLSKCTLYTSTEPCAMCSGAIYYAGIGKVIYGCSAERLSEIAGPHLTLPCREVFGRGQRSVQVIGPILEELSAAQHLKYWK